MSQPPWVREGDNYRCKTHDEVFNPGGAKDGLASTCSGCKDNRGEPLDAEVDAPLDAPPAGCESSEQHERELTAIAKFADLEARALTRGRRKTKTVAAVKAQPNLAVKMLDLAVKARRAAAAAAVRREDEEIVKARERRQRARDRGGRGAAN